MRNRYTYNTTEKRVPHCTPHAGVRRPQEKDDRTLGACLPARLAKISELEIQ